MTGSSDGIGQETARQLAESGHRVVLHARDDARAEDAAAALPGASGVAVGDLSVVAGIHRAAESASALGPDDAVIHNAGVGGADRAAPDGRWARADLRGQRAGTIPAHGADAAAGAAGLPHLRSPGVGRPGEPR